ncbi:GPR157 [Mytilus edulis]|uniref:GPR157 n=1 Tax=Mytilus edulis TaxID=6550 RepID=A0A8S3U1N2_MYTED|nr:GPR157 [Mytilus edulis]
MKRRKEDTQGRKGCSIECALSITALSKNLLGSDLTVGSGAWCWISACLSQTERTIWMTLTMKGWEILMYILCALFYILLKRFHWKEKIRAEKAGKMAEGINAPRFIRLQSVPYSERKYTKVDKRFMYLWLIELFLRSFGTVRFVMATIKRHTGHAYTSYDKADTILFHFQNFGDSAQALCSFIVFCAFSARTRELVRMKCFGG